MIMQLVTAVGRYFAAGFGKRNGKAEKCCQLRRKGLGTGNTDFSAGARRHDNIRLARNGTAIHIDKTNGLQP